MRQIERFSAPLRLCVSKKREITTATIRAEVYWDAEVSEERHAVGYEHIKYTQHDSTSTILLALFTLTHDSALSFICRKKKKGGGGGGSGGNDEMTQLKTKFNEQEIKLKEEGKVVDRLGRENVSKVNQINSLEDEIVRNQEKHDAEIDTILLESKAIEDDKTHKIEVLENKVRALEQHLEATALESNLESVAGQLECGSPVACPAP